MSSGPAYGGGARSTSAGAVPRGLVGAVQVAAAHDLDDLAVHDRRGPVSLRWIYLDMVRELARHAGHGDILREQLLSAGGHPA